MVGIKVVKFAASATMLKQAAKNDDSSAAQMPILGVQALMVALMQSP